MSECAEPGSKANQATGDNRGEGGWLLRRTQRVHTVIYSWVGEECFVPFSCFHAGRKCPEPEGAMSEQTGGTSWAGALCTQKQMDDTRPIQQGLPGSDCTPNQVIRE